jgi:dihydroorotase
VNPFLQDRKYGKIETGYTASLTVLNMNRPVTIRREDMQTKCGWSPFEGVTFPGSVEALFLDGKPIDR